MKLNWLAMVGFALLVAPTAEAMAGDDPSGSSGFKYQSLVRRLKPGQDVRVDIDPARSPLWLQLAAASRDGIVGTINDGGLEDSVAVQWSDIRRLDVRGRATGTGCAIGLLVGALGGGAFGVAMGKSFESSSSEVTSAALYFGAIGAFAGGLVGALVGSSIPTWDAIYLKK